MITSAKRYKIFVSSDKVWDWLVSIVSYSCSSLMVIALVSQFHIYLVWGQQPFSIVS